MPAEVHHLVDKLLAKDDFYPEKSEEEREHIAWAIAQIQTGHGKRHKKKSGVAKELSRIASALDQNGLHDLADSLTEVMTSLALPSGK